MSATTFRPTLLLTLACLFALAATGCADLDSPTSPTASPGVGSAPLAPVDRVSQASSSTASEETAQIAGLFPGLPDFQIPSILLPPVPRIPWVPEIPGTRPIDLNPSLPPDLTTILNPAGKLLADAIRVSESQARRSCNPIPEWVVRRLRGMMADATLSACYSTDWGATQNLTLQQTILGNGLRAAVTLNRVIVFASPDYALSQNTNVLKLWIHELTHVEQYARLGIDNFANKYSLESWNLESDADSNAGRILAQMGVDPSRPTLPVIVDPPVTQPISPPVTTPIGNTGGLVPVRCVTAVGVSDYFMGVPGGQCYMFTPWGPVSGIAR